MGERITVNVDVEIPMDVEALAKAFAALNDDAQARFICIAAAELEKYCSGDRRSLGTDWQWFAVGRHLRDCSCSTDEGREAVRSIVAGMEPSDA